MVPKICEELKSTVNNQEAMICITEAVNTKRLISL